MKLIYTLISTAFIVSACQKEIHRSSTGLSLPGMRENLKDSMRSEDYGALDFTRAVYNHVDSAGLYFLRIPFKGKTIAEKFVLVKMTADGGLKQGKIIQLDGGVREAGGGAVKAREWEGSISISSLNRQTVLSSYVHHGYIEAFHPQAGARETILPAPVLPEVVVVTYVHSFDAAGFSTWLWLNSFFYPNNYDVGGGGGGASNDGYYGSLDGYGGGGGGSAGYTVGGGAGVTQGETIQVDVDTYVDHPAINVDQYLKCFSGIPDQGSTCSIEIFTDIPVDSDPGKLFNWQTRSPGHTFLQLKKLNADGTQMVIQNIGFYPTANWKNILDADPVDSKMVDDGDHEFNASLKMKLSPYSFSSVLGKIKELSTLKYDMDEFNCTDFALEVFNYVRTPLEIPQYGIPGGIGTNASNTPQGLYVKLRDMKNGGDPEAANISLPGVKGWVTNSNGPCN
jgi:hypothetical protein